MSSNGYYDFETYNKINYDYGYQIILFQHGDKYDEENYNNVVESLKKQSSDERICLKIIDGVAYPSFNIEDKDAAIQLSRVYGDGYIWDWENNNEIITNFSVSNRKKI